MADKDKGSYDPGDLQGLCEVGGDVSGVLRLGARATESEPGWVEGAGAGSLREQRMDFQPGS